MLFQPKTVGPLTIDKKLGSDGVCDTYSGTLKVDTDRVVTVRGLRDWLIADKTLLSSVEARVGDLLALRHPRLVRILDFISEGDDRYVVEECVRGIDMTTLIDTLRSQRAGLPPNVFLHFALQLCTSVEALHNRRGRITGDEPILHRSIRPSGISVSVEGSVRLGGYGLLTTPNLVPKHARRGAVSDRTAFLAPEQVEDGRPTSIATDVFSLGAVLYYMLTGQILFDAASDLQSTMKIRDCNVSDQIAATRRLIPGVERVFARCLAAKPGRRYQAVHVLRLDLRALTEAYDNSRITEDVLDVLAAVGLEPTSRTAPMAMPQRHDPEREDVTDEPTARDGALAPGRDSGLAPLQYRDDLTEDVATDPGVEQHTELIGGQPEATVPTPSQGHSAFVDSMLGGPQEEDPSVPDVDDSDLEPLGASIGGAASMRLPPMPTPSVARLAPMPREDDVPVVERTARSMDAVRETTDQAISHSHSHAPEKTPVVLRQVERIDDEEPRFPVALAAVATAAALVIAFFGGMQLSSMLPGAEPVPRGRPLVPDAVVVSAPDVVSSGTPGRPTEVIAAPPRPETVETVEVVEVADQPPEVALRPTPAVAAAMTPSPAVATRPTPTSTPTTTATRPTNPAIAASQPVTAPATRTTPPAPPSQVAAAVQTQPAGDASGGWTPPLRLDDPSGLAARASEGRLTESDRTLLEGLDLYHPDFTRARVWLYEDATKRSVLAERKRHVQALMRLPENTYNPVFLIEEAQVAIASKDFETALSRARRAEQHWARLPSSAVFHKKATIYEQQAAAWYGLFVGSEGDDIDALNQSIRAWERYRQHVGTRAPDLAARADEQIARLSDIQRRVE